MKPILNIENLTKIYGNVPSQTKALNGITFQVMPGEFLGIMGSSGSGKSTLLNCIATVIQPTGGSIQVEGVNLQALKGRTLADYRGKIVGYLFQNFELLDNLTGRENILLPTSLHGIPEKESSQRLSQLAKYLEINDVLKNFLQDVRGAAAACSGSKGANPEPQNDSCRRAYRCFGFQECKKHYGKTVRLELRRTGNDLDGDP